MEKEDTIQIEDMKEDLQKGHKNLILAEEVIIIIIIEEEIKM